MFKFLHKSTPTHPTTELSRAMVDAGRAASSDVGALFRARAAGHLFGPEGHVFPCLSRAVSAAAYADLDSHPDLVRAAGHVERDGAIVLNRAYAPALAPAGLG